MSASSHRVEEREAIAIQAATMLMDLDAPSCAEILSSLPDDSRAQEAMLIGLLASENAEGGPIARAVKRIGIGRADTLALLVIARHCPELTAPELRNLGNVVSGQTAISDSLLVQASWLYLRHAGRLEAAVSEIFVPSHSAR